MEVRCSVDDHRQSTAKLISRRYSARRSVIVLLGVGGRSFASVLLPQVVLVRVIASLG